MRVKSLVRATIAAAVGLFLWPLAAAALEPLAVYEDWSQGVIRSDRWQGGRVFGNRKGKYALSLDQYPQLRIFPALSTQRYKELNRLAEELFVR